MTRPRPYLQTGKATARQEVPVAKTRRRRSAARAPGAERAPSRHRPPQRAPATLATATARAPTHPGPTQPLAAHPSQSRPPTATHFRPPPPRLLALPPSSYLSLNTQPTPQGYHPLSAGRSQLQCMHGSPPAALAQRWRIVLLGGRLVASVPGPCAVGGVGEREGGVPVRCGVEVGLQVGDGAGREAEVGPAAGPEARSEALLVARVGWAGEGVSPKQSTTSALSCSHSSSPTSVNLPHRFSTCSLQTEQSELAGKPEAR